MKRNLSILVLLLVGLALWASTREPADVLGNWIRLEIPDGERTLSWQRAGDRYVSTQSKVVLSLVEVAQMRQELRRTSRGRQYFAQEVGLTPEAIGAHREQILKTCSIEKLPAELEHCLDYQTVLANAQRLAFMEDSFHFAGQEMSLVIDGTPPLRVTRRSVLFGFLQPSTVNCGGATWETCSLATVDAFTRLLERDSKYYRSVSEGRTFWEDAVWTHDDTAFGVSIWGELVGEYQMYSDLPAFRKRPGFEQLSQCFRIVSLYAPSEGEFYLTAVPLKPSALDFVDWSNTSNQPLGSLLDVHRRCQDDVVAHHGWLLDWKNSGAGRAIQLKVDPAEPEDYDRSQWRQAGLRGDPEYELELLDHERSCARVWLSSQSSEGLIPWATPKSGMTVNDPCDDGQVLVVDGSGQVTRKSIGKLQDWGAE